MRDDTAECNCYVRNLKFEVRFCLHNGAHNPSCPWYRTSRDPVDRANDDDFRRAIEMQPPSILEVR